MMSLSFKDMIAEDNPGGRRAGKIIYEKLSDERIEIIQISTKHYKP